MTMHILTTFLLLYVVYVTANQSLKFSISQDDMDKFMKCVNEFGYTDVELKEPRKYFEENADTRFKCFQACQYKADNIINNGQLDVPNLVKFHYAENIEKLKKIIMDCANKAKGSDDCDLAYNTEKCIYDIFRPPIKSEDSC